MGACDCGVVECFALYGASQTYAAHGRCCMQGVGCLRKTSKLERKHGKEVATGWLRASWEGTSADAH